jgi:hypothetical protein
MTLSAIVAAKLGGEVRMEILSPGRVIEVLRKELDVRGISLREIDRRLQKAGRETIRQAFTERRDGRLTLDQFSWMLEAAEIDAQVFLVMVAGGEVPLRTLVEFLVAAEDPAWNRYEKGVLAGVKMRRLQGSSGFEEVHARLQQIEGQREEDPEAARSAAWQTVENATEAGLPGATAAALAVLAGCSSRARARTLFEAALKIVGDDPPSSLLAGKIYGNLGRVLREAGYPQQALRIVRYRAYPDVDLHGGDGDDSAVLLLEMSRASRAAGDLDFGLGCLELAAADGGERLCFVATHELAATLLSEGREMERVSQLYDELVAMPHFVSVSPAVKVLAGCSRLKAHLRTGRLSSGDLPAYDSAWHENKASLGKVERVRLGLDYAELLQQLGDHEKAGELLQSEFWPMLELDGDATGLQSRYSATCIASGISVGHQVAMLGRNRELFPPSGEA